jgi:MFS family permease
MSESATPDNPTAEPGENRTPWYHGVTRYQWLVLAIASAGWIFDVFEGQLFVIYKTPAMAEVLDVDRTTQAGKDAIDAWSIYALASFLLGGALGGLVFGILADRIGRQKSMIWSIAVYSFFTALHFWVTDAWQIIALRFFVAMGVGGEWAIAASLVSEVFPKRARAAAGGIFHASSVLGAVFASLCGMLLNEADWRFAFLIGLLPALLIVWIRASLQESEKWQESQSSTADSSSGAASGSLTELLTTPSLLKRALIGLSLASIGLGTYWGIYAWGPELVRQVLTDDVDTLSGEDLDQRVVDVLTPHIDESLFPPEETNLKSMTPAEIAVWKVLGVLAGAVDETSEKIKPIKDNEKLLTDAVTAIEKRSSRETVEPLYRELARGQLGSAFRSSKGSSAYLLMNFTGGLLGLLCFAPLASYTSRRMAFAVYHIGALVLAPATFLLADSYEACVVLLSVMAFFVVGMHAGYAIYFPELFPTRLRATGASFCFNVARLVSAIVIVGRVPLKAEFGLRYAVSIMALLFAFGLVAIWFAPETRDAELED